MFSHSNKPEMDVKFVISLLIIYKVMFSHSNRRVNNVLVWYSFIKLVLRLKNVSLSASVYVISVKSTEESLYMYPNNQDNSIVLIHKERLYQGSIWLG